MPWNPRIRANWIPRDTPDDIAVPLLKERISSQTEFTTDGCWLFKGPKNLKGYGETTFRGKRHMVHRLMYELHHGQIPSGHLICHRCDRPSCWNPTHLWAGTPKQNSLDMSAKRRQRWQRHTHCKRGHEFSGKNLGIFYREGRPIRRCNKCQSWSERQKRRTEGKSEESK
jgi:hypothetical protein